MSDSEDTCSDSTMPRKRKREVEVPCAQYDFTHWTDTTESLHSFVQMLRQLFKMWVFQKEACPTTGRLHYQGRGSLMKKKRWGELKSLLAENDWKMHVSPSSNPSQILEIFYFMKIDTRVEGPWDNRSWKEPEYIPRQYRGIEHKLWPYQKQIIESKNEFEPRRVHLVYDPIGNCGKSTVAALGHLIHGGFDIPTVSDHQQLIQCVCNKLRDANCRDPKLLFLDLPRAALKDDKHFGPFMSTIEMIKKGKSFDMRNHYKEWWFDSPQIWVFTNQPPSMYLLSPDRWVVWTIVDRVLQPYKHFINVVPDVPGPSI